MEEEKGTVTPIGGNAIGKPITGQREVEDVIDSPDEPTEREKFFERRSKVMQAWEDLTVLDGADSMLQFDPDISTPRNRFSIRVKGGDVREILAIADRRGLDAENSFGGIMLRIAPDSEEAV